MTELLGYAVGVIGISLDDFGRLTYGEFQEIAKADRERREQEHRDNWERMRMHAVMTMQPHCKRRLTCKGVLPFPWEKEERRKPEGEVLDKASALAAYEEYRRLHTD